jgi:hypothetical protein
LAVIAPPTATARDRREQHHAPPPGHDRQPQVRSFTGHTP